MLRQLFRSLAFSMLIIFGFSGAAHAQSIHGVFRVVKGDVKVVQGSDQKEVKAKIGQKIFAKDVIIAGAESRAKVVMVDNNEINISPDSRIEIQSYEFKPDEDKKNVILNVLYGKVRAKVNQKYEGDNKFQVKTPSAVAGVRGTDFITSYSKNTNETKVVTFEGRVAFGQPGPGGSIVNPVMVAKGETTSQLGSAPPAPPISVPKAELAGMDTESDANKAPDRPSQDARQPAETDPGKDDKKDEPKDEKKDNDNNRNKDKDKANNKDKERNPSSVAGPGSPGGSMLLEDDFAGSSNPNTPPVPPAMGNLPIGPAPMPTNMLPPKNDFINDVIGSTRKKIIINVTTGP